MNQHSDAMKNLARIQGKTVEELMATDDLGMPFQQMTTFLAIDVSGSMGVNGRLDEAKEGAKAFAVDLIDRGDRVGVVSFGSNAHLLAPAGTDREAVTRAVDAMKIGLGTNMTAGIKMAQEQLAGCDGVREIVVVSDGEPNSRPDAYAAADAAKADGIVIKTIGVGGANLDVLRYIASDADQAKVVDVKQLGSSIKALAIRPEDTEGGDIFDLLS